MDIDEVDPTGLWIDIRGNGKTKRQVREATEKDYEGAAIEAKNPFATALSNPILLLTTPIFNGSGNLIHFRLNNKQLRASAHKFLIGQGLLNAPPSLIPVAHYMAWISTESKKGIEVNGKLSNLERWIDHDLRTSFKA